MSDHPTKQTTKEPWLFSDVEMNRAFHLGLLLGLFGGSVLGTIFGVVIAK